jgi:hypothetical protein
MADEKEDRAFCKSSLKIAIGILTDIAEKFEDPEVELEKLIGGVESIRDVLSKMARGMREDHGLARETTGPYQEALEKIRVFLVGEDADG